MPFADRKDETQSQLSELTFSTSHLNVSDEENDAVFSMIMNQRKDTSDTSQLNPETYIQTYQQIRRFYSRNSAYERAMKLSQVLQIDEKDSNNFDNSVYPTILFIVSVLLSFLCFLPLMVESREDLARFFRSSITEASCLSTSFLVAAGFVLGCCAPLVSDLSLQATTKACRMLRKEPIPESVLHSYLMGQSRTAYCLSVIKPTLILFAFYCNGNHDQIAPYFMCQLYWEPVIYSAIGVHFISKYTPKVVSMWYLLTMYSCLLGACSVSSFVAIGYEVAAIPIIQGCCWTFAGAMYLYYLYREGLRLRAEHGGTPKISELSAVTVSLLYIHIVIIAMIALEWITTLVCNDMTRWSPLNISLNEAVTHLLSKCLIAILFSLLPVNLASTKMAKTKGALHELLAVANDRPDEEQEKVPLDVYVHDGDMDSSV